MFHIKMRGLLFRISSFISDSWLLKPMIELFLTLLLEILSVNSHKEAAKLLIEFLSNLAAISENR